MGCVPAITRTTRGVPSGSLARFRGVRKVSLTKSRDPEGYTYQSRDPEGCTYQSSDPEGSTYQSSDPEGCTYQSRDPEGYTLQSREPEGYTYQFRDPEGYKYQSRDPEGCTYQSSDPEGCTYQSRDPEGCTYQSSDPEGSTYQSSDPEGCTEGYTYQSRDPKGCTYQSSIPVGYTYQSSDPEGCTYQSVSVSVYKLNQTNSLSLINSLIGWRLQDQRSTTVGASPAASWRTMKLYFNATDGQTKGDARRFWDEGDEGGGVDGRPTAAETTDSLAFVQSCRCRKVAACADDGGREETLKWTGEDGSAVG
ncbi:foot protein 1 variant 1-like [Cucumis melo var. makuwa]|uniref:Foot protein 1 variant 1-like n=1 Tax=Cucumis melo var. makuwa TaxID=1194695 RepID=A0A5D3CSH9_CUCMM|nr:foot protein 1 variant 1-like [Cucumis melo var. makuwa]